MFELQLPGSELRTRPFCFTCKAETGSLKTCSRCGIVKYCNVDCQKNNFKDHKEPCKVIKFFYLPNLKLRCSMINHLFTLGIKSRDKSILTSALSYCSSYLFLESHDEDMSFVRTLLYLYLNQDPKALEFMKNKSTAFDDNEIYEWTDFDYINDIVMAAIIKCRTVQRSRFVTAGFETFLEVMEGHHLLQSRPAIEKIQKYLGVLDAANFNRQKDHFIKYLDHIENVNLIFLKSLINPEPLLAIKNIGLNDRTKEGSLTEALTLLKMAGPLLQENDYAMKMIVKKVGKNPTYPTSGKPIRVM